VPDGPTAIPWDACLRRGNANRCQARAVEWSCDELEASWQAPEECGFDLISCFDHVTDAREELAAWDAPSPLAAMASLSVRVLG
jgi:hypothetical protein